MGIVTAAIVTIVTLKCFQSAIEADTGKIDVVWRLILALGIVPAACALYFRLTIPESPRYTMAVAGDHQQALEDSK